MNALAVSVIFDIIGKELEAVDHILKNHLRVMKVTDNPLRYMCGEDLRGTLCVELPVTQELLDSLRRCASEQRRLHYPGPLTGVSGFLTQARRIENVIAKIETELENK
jgi:hypothetical protein